MRQGSDSEDRAADFLLSQGYTLLTRRFKGHLGELDLVAMDFDTLVFVEVKARSTKLSRPEEAMTADKIRRLLSCAEEYSLEFELSHLDQRFDLILIDPSGIRHVQDAFQNLG